MSHTVLFKVFGFLDNPLSVEIYIGNVGMSFSILRQ